MGLFCTIIGSRVYLWQLPLGTRVYNIELLPGQYVFFARAAGKFAVGLRKTENYVVLKLPFKELKMFYLMSLSNIGQVSNSSNKFWSMAKRVFLAG